MRIQFFGAAGEVTGSCHLVQTGQYRILLDCGLIQGRPQDEARNKEPFPFDPASLDAVILSHSHIDHSGRIPLLVKAGYKGPIYTQTASRDLCRIMLRDAAYLNEKNTEWLNRKRERKGLPLEEPLYTRDDASYAVRRFKTIDYDQDYQILPGVTVKLRDAGHILGSAIVELRAKENGEERCLVFSGDLGKADTPILRDPSLLYSADRVVMEGTYGDRLHRSNEATLVELQEVFRQARAEKGNILIPAFAVGRSQELLYLFGKYYKEWELDRWLIFLDSPMAIEATDVYTKHSELYDKEATDNWRQQKRLDKLPNLTFTRTANQSMRLNIIRSGAIIIAGSGMCTGGRIRHHLKHNVWRSNCHVIFVGYQARGTPGQIMVSGAQRIRLWGETIRVAAKIHTVGGLSAHADQAGLTRWYQSFRDKPPLTLVHGEAEALLGLKAHLHETTGVQADIATHGQTVEV